MRASLSIALTVLALPPAVWAQAGSAAAVPADGRGDGAGRRNVYDLTYGAIGRITWTDNVNLAARGREQSDSIYEIAPYLTATAATSRVQGSLTYAPRYITRNRELDGDGLRHQLDASGNVFLLERRAGLQARALVADVNANPFGTISNDPSLNASNRGIYRQFGLTPYLAGPIGRSADYDARYSIGYTNDGQRPYSVLQHSVAGRLSSSEAVGPYGWFARGEYRSVEYDYGFDYDRSQVDLVGTYTVAPGLRFGLGATYAQSDLLLGDDGKRSGWGPTATFFWAPTTRSVVDGIYSRTYYGQTATVRANHRAQSWLFALLYTDTVQDGAEAGAVFFDQNQAFNTTPSQPGQNPVGSQLATQGVLPQAASALSTGSINSTLVHSRTLTATVGYTFARTAVFATGVLRRQDNDVNVAVNVPGGSVPQVLDQRSLLLRVTQRIDAKTQVGAGYQYQQSESNLLAARTNVHGILVDVSREIVRNVDASLGYRHNQQRGDGASVIAYDENAVFAALAVRF